MKQNLTQSLVTGNKAPTILADYALEFNGTDEYLQIALPNNIASGNTNDWTSSGSKPAAWAETGTIVWNATSEIGATSTYSVSLTRSGGPPTEITIPGLTAGKKYKLRLRYKGTYCYISYGGASTTFLSTSEWNAITIIFTAVGTSFYLGGSSGTCYVDYLSIKEDQGFDLNKDQEQILHSRNALFNNAGTDWVAKDVSSNQQCTLSTVDKSEGTGSLLITATSAGDATNHHVLLPSANLESCVATKKYTLQGEARSDTAGRTITARIGGKEVTSATLSTTAGTFTKFVLNFEATASEVNQDLKLWLSGAGSVFVDKLSLTQAYDMWVGRKLKINVDNAAKGVNYLSDTHYMEFRSGGVVRNQINDMSSGGVDNRLTTYEKDVWLNMNSYVDRTNRSFVVKNGVSDAGVVCTNLGKSLASSYAVFIGANNVGTERFNGQISHLQIIRFENISLSTFNSAIKGLQYPTGGGAEEVLRLTFQSGVSTTELVRDYSPKGHTVTMVNMSLDNRCKITEINRLLDNTSSGTTYQYLTDSDGQYIGVSY